MESEVTNANEDELVIALTPAQALVALGVFILVVVLWRARRAG